MAKNILTSEKTQNGGSPLPKTWQELPPHVRRIIEDATDLLTELTSEPTPTSLRARVQMIAARSILAGMTRLQSPTAGEVLRAALPGVQGSIDPNADDDDQDNYASVKI